MIYFTAITQQKFKVLFVNMAKTLFYKNILKNNKNNSHTETKQIYVVWQISHVHGQRENTILNMENYKWCLHNSLTHKCKSPVSLIMQISPLTIGSPVLLVSLTLGVPFAAQLQLYL